jgi:hypothetical protein
MTAIFLASDSADDHAARLAFSNLGSALDYVRDSHADMNPEGSALMLDGTGGPVPASNKAVKDTSRNILRFSAAGADAASVVAAVTSKLDGAISACQALGVDPANVAKVTELRTDLATAQATVTCTDEAVSFRIQRLTLHKRGYKRS